MNVRQQTHQRVLPQPAALEPASVDNPRVGTKRGVGVGFTPASGVQHGRGETGSIHQGGPASRSSVSAAEQHGRGDSATKVFVLDKHGRPLQPTHPARARELLAKGRARVHRVTPFVIRLVDRTIEDSAVDGVEVGIDPGSKTTGIAVFTVTDEVSASTGEVSTVREGVWLGELIHRGLAIKNALHSRAALRRGRRSRNTRYRAPRFLNRRHTPNHPLSGVWLPPSLNHRLDGVVSWVRRLSRWAPVRAVHIENVSFDTHLLANPDVTGVGYQYGTLHGFEIREYVLTKWGRSCVYCDKTGVPLNLDHVVARSRGGSDRVSNLVPACIDCNKAKDNLPVEQFLAHDSARLARIKRQMQTPLRDAAAVNATRWAIWRAANTLGAEYGFTVHSGTGGRTKYNRVTQGVPKTHALDALCVGAVDRVTDWPTATLAIKSTGRGSYARTQSDKYGFPRLRLSRTKQHHGFATGDHVRAVVPAGKKAGTHVGRVAVRATGSFNITTRQGTVQGIHHRHVQLIQRADGYAYQTTATPERKEKSAA